MKVRSGTGSRKYVVVMTVLGMGFVLCGSALALAAFAKLTPDYVRVLEVFSGMASVAIGSFSLANAAEHWSKRGKEESDG